MKNDYTTYLSPFTWRYGSAEMRHIWSEEYKRTLWRRIWLALAEEQSEFGLVTPDQLADLQDHVGDIDIQRALEIEDEIHHDLVAELRTYAEQCPRGGGVLHLGATSMDIKDNAEALQVRDSLTLVNEALRNLLLIFVNEIEKWAETPLMAFTHLQPAEPSSLGYRLAQYAQDLYIDLDEITRVGGSLRGKGFKGAVGTGASYAELIGRENLVDFEKSLSNRLDINFFPVSTQTYPRKQDFQVISALSGLGGSLYKFAFDLRLLQSPPIGEIGEPFGERQVGSSAMPFKRNPINAEKIDSLARALAQMPRLAWDNAAHSLLERTLDDSANRRTLLPEAFLVTDEILMVSTRIIERIQVDQSALVRNLAIYGPFAATERVLMATVKRGADRQVMHEHLRQLSLAAWSQVREEGENPLTKLMLEDRELLKYLDGGNIRSLMDVEGHLGDAPERAHALAQNIRAALL
jgi:adenylosuccinate lyase